MLVGWRIRMSLIKISRLCLILLSGRLLTMRLRRLLFRTRVLLHCLLYLTVTSLSWTTCRLRLSVFMSLMVRLRHVVPLPWTSSGRMMLLWCPLNMCRVLVTGVRRRVFMLMVGLLNGIIMRNCRDLPSKCRNLTSRGETVLSTEVS